MKPVFVALFLALVTCKAFFGWSDSLSDVPSVKVYAALLSALFLGLPQIICLVVVAIKEMTRRRAADAVSAIMVFLVTAWYFGTLPGTRGPKWGGEFHFEVPVMIVVELFVAVAFAIAYTRFSPRDAK